MEVQNIDSIREEILTRRKERGWSQKQLAMKAGVSVNTIFLLEKKGNDIYLDTLLKILTALGMRLDITLPPMPVYKRSVFRY